MKSLMRSVLPILIVCLACAPAVGAKQQRGAKGALLPDGYPELTQDDAALTKVPGIDSAPAVVLLEARQQRWERHFSRIHYYYRIKILNEDGIEEYGDYSRSLIGKWRVKKVEARTILPGGEVIDVTEGIFEEESTDGVDSINVTWPRVQVGAILDLHMSLTADYATIPEWIVQGYLPVLESRFIMVPPTGMTYATAVHGFPEALREPDVHRRSEGKVLVWRFENVPALPREPNQPPLMNIAKKLFVIPTDIRDPYTSAKVALARDWKSYSYYGREGWESWMKVASSDAKSLAKQVAGQMESPTAKAEAIRRALREKVHVEHVSDWVLHDSPNEVLSMGTGTSGEVAATAVVMLHAVGVDADLAAIRLRTSGLMPSDMPVPSLFNDLLVRFTDGREDVFFSPASDLPVGSLSWTRRGITALPFDGKCEQPLELPDYTAEENRTVATVEAKLDKAGLLTGRSTHTYHDVAAQKWRARLKDLDAEERRERIQSRLRRWMPGLQLNSYEIEHLGDHTEDVVVKCEWEVAGYASKVPFRLLVNLQLLDRMSAEDWPTQERHTEIHLGGAYERSVVVTLELPEDATEVVLPPDALKKADPVGVYRAKYRREGDKVIAERSMRMDRYWFPPESYAGLSRWFQDIAADDDKVAVVSFR